MKLYLILIFILFSLGSFSQQDSTEIKKKDKFQIEFLTQLNYGSTNLTNEFMNKLFWGGRIENDLKDEILAKTNKTNRFGVEINYETKVYILDTLFEKHPDYTYYIGFGSFRNVSVKYSQDFFRTVFYGNKPFTGETVILGKTKIIDTKFEKITFGILHKNRNTSLGISLIIGDKHNSFNFKQADLFTNTNGRALTLDYDGKILRSDSSNTGFFAFSGSGLGLDFHHIFFNKYALNISNFGFTIWKRNAKYSNVEKNYEYTGLEIDNLINIKDGEIEDRANELLPETENKTFATLLPTTFRVDKTFDFKKKIQPIYGVKYKLLSNYFPSAYAGVHYNMNTKIGFSGALAYGGYTKLRATAGAYLNYKKIYAGIETSNLIGIFSKKSNGNGGNFYLFTHF